jgi:predicted nucleic-acid-binding protein
MIADTNILLRAALGDDPKQTKLAHAELANADVVVIPVVVLCEFVWVLTQGYKMSSDEVAGAIRGYLDSAKVMTNRPVVEAGLALLESGGDFADGAIAFEGVELGGQEFVSFDKEAVKLLERQGYAGRVPG